MMMIKNEWRSIIKNPLMIVVLIAIIMIPTIYAGLFLASMWDPYGNLDKLPVAVVNEDAAVEYNGVTLDVGNELVENLRESGELQFNFVDAQTAQEGLENGTYYMTVTIPEDFSANAATLLDDEPKKMELSYKTNPGKNYIASKLSDTALSRIQSGISEQITKTYSETVFEQLSGIGDSLDSAAEGSGELEDGLGKLSDGNGEITDNLKTLAESSLTFVEGSQQLSDGVKEYTDGVAKVKDGAKQLDDGAKTLSSSASKGVSKLKSGSSELKNGVDSYTDGVSEAAKGAKKLNKNSSSLNEGAQQISSGSQQLYTASGAVLDGLNLMSQSLGESLSAENKAQIDALTEGCDTLHGGIKKLDKAVSEMQLPDLSSAAQGITVPAAAIGSDAQSAGSNLANMQGYLTSLASAYPELLSDADYLSLCGEVSSCASNVSDIGVQLESMNSAAAGLSSLSTMGGSIDELKTSVSQLKAGADQVLPAAKTTIVNLEGGLETIQNALDRQGKTAEDMGLIQGMGEINGGLKTLSGGAASLCEGTKTYTDGVSSLNSGLGKINANSSALVSGAAELDSGVGELSGALTKGVKTLTDGTGSLYSGAKTLDENSAELKNGASALNEGAEKISDGAQKLEAGSETLGSGLSDAFDGADTLKSGLSGGAEEIKNIKTNEQTYDMFSSPVETTKQEYTQVADNGHGMAPYMMSVGLWVGTLAFCIMYPLMESHGEITSGVSWWLSKATVLHALTQVMAVLMLLVLHFACGFEPASWGKTIIVACLASIAFMSIQYFMNVALGKVGSFLMLIFMVVQLAGAAGTYPVEISGGFVGKIHYLVPFTYTVDAFRTAIAGKGSILPCCIVMGVILAVFSVLTVILFNYRAKCRRLGKRCLYDFIEEKGLA
ncbi:MAG: YhgE/Pip family protein [Oscillospiraceae bacterium]